MGNASEGILTIAAFLTALTVISIFVFKVYKIAKRIDDALGVDKQGRTVSDRLARVEHQLFPNGGSSLTDKINRIEADQKILSGKVESYRDILSALMRKETE